MMKKTAKELVEEAMSRIETIDFAQAQKLHDSGDAVFVDIRDIRELQQQGKVKGAEHCPRGMLEFWCDLTSPYAKEFFKTDKKLVLYCALGSRSALAVKTMQDMGFSNVTHIAGGFTAWNENKGQIEQLPEYSGSET